MTDSSRPLQARTQRLDADIDLVAVAGANGCCGMPPIFPLPVAARLCDCRSTAPTPHGVAQR